MVTYRVFEFGAAVGMFLSDLGHNGVRDSVAGSSDHVDVGRVEELLEYIYKCVSELGKNEKKIKG